MQRRPRGPAIYRGKEVRRRHARQLLTAPLCSIRWTRACWLPRPPRPTSCAPKEMQRVRCRWPTWAHNSFPACRRQRSSLQASTAVAMRGSKLSSAAMTPSSVLRQRMGSGCGSRTQLKLPARGQTSWEQQRGRKRRRASRAGEKWTIWITNWTCPACTPVNGRRQASANTSCADMRNRSRADRSNRSSELRRRRRPQRRGKRRRAGAKKSCSATTKSRSSAPRRRRLRNRRGWC